MSEEPSATDGNDTPKVYSLFTGKPVDGEALLDPAFDLPEPDELELKANAMFCAIDALAERIHDEIGPKDFSESTQVFLLMRKPGTNQGLVYSSVDLRGPDLIGALGTVKLLVFNNYFEYEIE